MVRSGLDGIGWCCRPGAGNQGGPILADDRDWKVGRENTDRNVGEGCLAGSRGARGPVETAAVEELVDGREREQLACA